MKKFHRYALLDKRGKNRGTCEATSPREAIFGIRGPGKPLPEGWTIVDRGEVAEGTMRNLQLGGLLIQKAEVRTELLEEARDVIRGQAETISTLTQERNEARTKLEQAEYREGLANECLKDATGKLSDLLAIVRVAELAHESTDPEWTLPGLMREVASR